MILKIKLYFTNKHINYYIKNLEQLIYYKIYIFLSLIFRIYYYQLIFFYLKICISIILKLQLEDKNNYKI